MTSYAKNFQGQSKTGQFVETKRGEWEKYLDKGAVSKSKRKLWGAVIGIVAGVALLGVKPPIHSTIEAFSSIFNTAAQYAQAQEMALKEKNIDPGSHTLRVVSNIPKIFDFKVI